jgi:Uma2 family endonuclease
MAAGRVLRISVADYLTAEETGAVKPEFIGGRIHAMGGASLAHTVIAGNIFAALKTGLRGGSRRVFIGDGRCAWRSRESIISYPDVVVSCHPAGKDTLVLRIPTRVVEVLPPATESIDRRRKNLNFRTAMTLEDCVLMAHDRREVTIFRRATGWQSEAYPEAGA